MGKLNYQLLSVEEENTTLLYNGNAIATIVDASYDSLSGNFRQKLDKHENTQRVIIAKCQCKGKKQLKENVAEYISANSLSEYHYNHVSDLFDNAENGYVTCNSGSTKNGTPVSKIVCSLEKSVNKDAKSYLANNLAALHNSNIADNIKELCARFMNQKTNMKPFEEITSSKTLSIHFISDFYNYVWAEYVLTLNIDRHINKTSTNDSIDFRIDLVPADWNVVNKTKPNCLTTRKSIIYLTKNDVPSLNRQYRDPQNKDKYELYKLKPNRKFVWINNDPVISIIDFYDWNFDKLVLIINHIFKKLKLNENEEINNWWADIQKVSHLHFAAVDKSIDPLGYTTPNYAPIEK